MRCSRTRPRAALVVHPTARAACAMATALAAMTLTASAMAAGPVGPYSALDLAAEAIPLPDALAEAGIELSGAEVLLVGGASQTQPCTVDVTDGQIISAGAGTCPAIWAMATPVGLQLAMRDPEDEDAAPIGLTLAPQRTPARSRLTLEGQAITFPEDFPEGVGEVAILAYEGGNPRGWEMQAIEDGRIAVDAATAEGVRRLAGRYMVYGRSEDGGVWEWAVALATATPTPTPTVGPTQPYVPAPEVAATAMTAAEDPALPPALACPPAKLPHDDMIVVCVDATGPSMSYRMHPAGLRQTKPNRHFYIHVLHRADHKVTVDLGGQMGSYVPGSRVAGGTDTGFNLGGQQVELTATVRRFAPRLPGPAPLTVRLYDLANQPLVDPLLVELWIETTYSGAFRIGLAGVFAGGVDQQFRVVTQEGSGQGEIVATDGNLMDLDLVIGYSPYLDSGGRSETGCESAPFCFGPYFGIGVLSADAEGDLQWLKSVHLGVEWELTESFAVGVTANLRRVTRLAEGFRVGQPLDGEVPTESRFVFGVGVVINLSPAFFRVAAGGPAGVID